MSNEEGNEITLLALRQVGCELPEDCSGVDAFSPDLLVRVTSQCLLVSGNTEMAEYRKATLPPDMASKFRVCTELAEAVKKLGYREEIGFHQFLYPAEKSSRELVAFLLDRLPQATRGEQAVADMGGEQAASLRSIPGALSAASKRLRVPAVCRPRTLRASLHKSAPWAYPSVPLRTVPLRAPSGTAPIVSTQAWGPHGLAPSLFEANQLAADARKKEVDLDASADDLAASKAAFDRAVNEAIRSASGKGKVKTRDSLATMLEEWAGAKGPAHSSRFGRAAAFGQDKDDGLMALDAELSREERQKLAEEERMARLQREEEERERMVADMEQELNALQVLAQQLGDDFNLKVLSLRQVESDIDAATNQTEELIQAYKRKKKTLSLLANREENAAQLRAVSAETARRLLELASEWERVRLPLVEKLRDKKASLLRRKEGMQFKIGRIKEMRAEMETLADGVRAKDELVKALLKEHEALPKSALRSAYTRRLLELAKNMTKQKLDIESILRDTREIQADIATSWDTMKRSYASTDEMIFRDARDAGDPTSKKMYKQLVGMHECFAALASTMEKTGVLQNECRELLRRIEQEEARANVLNMEQVIKDLEEIKTENYALAQRAAKPQQ